MAGGTTRAYLLASLLTALLLAGCVGEETDPDDATGAMATDAAPGPGKVGADESALVGQVMASYFEPVAGATVVVQGTSLNATTDAQGRYLIEHITPGDHKVFAQAPGFAVNVRPVTLAAGKVSELNFIIEEVAGEDPHTTVLEESGFLECQTGAVALTMNCVPIQNVLNDLGTNPTNTKQILKWEFQTKGLEAIILEMLWDPPLEGTSGELQLLFESDSTDLVEGETFGSAQGASPVRLELLDEDLKPVLDSHATQFQTRTFPPFEPGTIVFQQKFTVFVSLFYYQLPTPGYSGVPDGFTP